MSARIQRAVSAKLPKTISLAKSSSQRSSADTNGKKIRPKTAFAKKVDVKRAESATQVNAREGQRQSIRDILTYEDEIRKLEIESQKRKKSMQELDKIIDEKLGKNHDPFAEEKRHCEEKLLDRALLAKHEQEDEVKRANQIIMAAKVHVLQDAQINEKKELEKKWREKELSLEKLMLEEDAKKIAEQKRQEQEWKESQEKYVIELKKGLKNRELQKLIEAERIENEAQTIAMAQELLKREEEEKKRAKLEQRNQLCKDFQKTIEVAETFKKRAEEQKREAEMKALEYMRQKAEREKELEKERKMQREKKQKEIDRILARQKELLQTKNDNEMANLRRIQEQKEREFRKQLMEAAVKKKELERQVQQARAAQVEETKRMKAKREELAALERQRELEVVKEEEQRKKADREKMHQLKEKYRAEIIRQIQQKQVTDHTKKIQSQKEYEEQKKKEELRQETIRKVIAAKVAEMRQSRIPEHIIRDVERQLNLFHNQ